MPFTTAAENTAVDAVTAAANLISLHTSDPGDTGTGTEVTGGTYARVATTWGAAANSSATGSSVTLDVPSGTTISHWGLWSDDGLTFYYGGALPASETFGSNGTYSLTPTVSATD